jgi:alkaline phosphatase
MIGRTLWLAMVAVCTMASPGFCQTIYPLNRAEILAGSRFDLKVEVPGSPPQSEVAVSINGQPAAGVLGSQVLYVPNEDGQSHSALWIKNGYIDAPGRYEVVAAAGGRTASVTWEVFATPPQRTARNVILFVGDGLSVAHRTAARMLSKGIAEGRYGGELAIDDMPHMALVSTSGTDSIVTDSANSAAAYTTGHKSCTGALGVYCSRTLSSLGHPNVETITSLVKRRLGLAVGVVTNTEIEDATPAAMVAHTRRRADYPEIVRMFHEAEPEVVLGGGSVHFLPKAAGGKREDGEDYVAKFQGKGYAFATTATELAAAAANTGTSRLLGLFNSADIDGALDRRILKKGSVRRYQDQPDLTEMVKAAIGVLSRKPEGFLLMVESGRIDKYSHSLDWERAVYDTIMLDNAVRVAKDWAGDRNDTLIVVVGDHAHPVSIIGTVDDDRPGTRLRDKLGIYADAGFPSYPAADAEGYPATVDVSRRLAFTFGAYPDHCTKGKPFVDGEFQPTKKTDDGKANVANEEYCGPTATRMQGNLPITAAQGVHSADDVILTAMGPGSQQFRGHMENTRVFRAIASALSIASQAGARDTSSAK